MSIIDKARVWAVNKLSLPDHQSKAYVPASLIPIIDTISTTGMSYQTLVSCYKSWVYIAVDKLAKTIASLPLQLYTYERNGKLLNGRQLKSAFAKDGLSRRECARWCKSHDIDRVLVEQHPVYELLNRPNDLQYRFQLWYDTVVKLEIGGQCAWYMPSNRLGIPAEIWPLPLRATGEFSARVTSQGLQGFTYADGQVKQQLERDEVLWFLVQSPSNFYAPHSPLMSQTYPYDIDNYMAQLQYYMFKNRAVPGTILTTEQRLTAAQVQSIIDQINTQYQGTTRAGRPMVLHSGMEMGGQITTPLKDMVIESIGQDVQDKLLSAYGVPAGKAGLVKDVNRANMEALDKTFFQETVGPRVMLIEEGIERDLLPRYDERLTADFVLPESSERTLDLQERRENLTSGFTTINEERAALGYDPVEWGEQPWLPAGWLQPDMERIPEPAPAPVPIPSGDDAGDGTDEDDEVSDVQTEEDSKSHRNRQTKADDRVDIAFDFDDPAVQRRLGDRLKKFSVEVTGTTWDEVSSVLREGFQEGLSLTQIADRVKSSFTGFANYRANNISRTEAVYSVSSADLECVEQNGLGDVMLKYWLSSRDNETRASHAAAETSYADGIALDAPFSVGDDSMQGPGMGSLAEENCNCRCSLGYRPKDAKSWAYDENKWAHESKANARQLLAYERLFHSTAKKLFARQQREVLAALNSKGERLKAMVNGWSLGKIRTHLKQTAAVSEIMPPRKQWEEQTEAMFEPTYAYVIESAGERRAEQLNRGSRR